MLHSWNIQFAEWYVIVHSYMLSISWLYISKCSCVVSECMRAVMFSFAYKWVLSSHQNYFATYMMKSLCRNLLHSFKSKARSYRTRMNALHCYLMYSWLLVHIQLTGEISPLVSISCCSRLEYLIDLMHLDLSTCTWIQAFDLSIAILLRTVSNVVIYVCDKYVTNIDKIISVGLDLSFRAHSLPSASM